MNFNLDMNLINKNLLNNNDLLICMNLSNKNYNYGKEVFINKCIKKTPKIKLHNIIKINKLYNQYYQSNIVNR